MPHGEGWGMGHKQTFYHSFYKTTLPFSNTTSLFFLCLLTLTKKQMEIIQRHKVCHKVFSIQAYFSANTGLLYNSAKTAGWTGIWEAKVSALPLIWRQSHESSFLYTQHTGLSAALPLPIVERQHTAQFPPNMILRKERFGLMTVVILKYLCSFPN